MRLPLGDPAFWYWFMGQVALTVLAVILGLRGSRHWSARKKVVSRLRHRRWIEGKSPSTSSHRDLVTALLRLPAVRFKFARSWDGASALLVVNGDRVALVVNGRAEERWRLPGGLDDIIHNKSLYAEGELDVARSLAQMRTIARRVPGARVRGFVQVPSAQRADRPEYVDPDAPPVMFTDEEHLAEDVARFLAGARPVLRVPVLAPLL